MEVAAMPVGLARLWLAASAEGNAEEAVLALDVKVILTSPSVHIPLAIPPTKYTKRRPNDSTAHG